MSKLTYKYRKHNYKLKKKSVKRRKQIKRNKYKNKVHKYNNRHKYNTRKNKKYRKYNKQSKYRKYKKHYTKKYNKRIFRGGREAPVDYVKVGNNINVLTDTENINNKTGIEDSDPNMFTKFTWGLQDYFGDLKSEFMGLPKEYSSDVTDQPIGKTPSLTDIPQQPITINSLNKIKSEILNDVDGELY